MTTTLSIVKPRNLVDSLITIVWLSILITLFGGSLTDVLLNMMHTVLLIFMDILLAGNHSDKIFKSSFLSLHSLVITLSEW